MEDARVFELHRQIMALANERGLSHYGVAVRVAGARLKFALVFAEIPGSSRWSLLGEYDWRVIERAALGDGDLR
jgi:hypothetical protein